MKELSLEYQLLGVEWLFSVPSADPLQNHGPLQPVFEQLLADLRGQRVPQLLQLTFRMPAAECQAGIIAEVRAAWSRVLASRIAIEQKRLAELLITRRSYLLKGLTVLFVCLGIGQLLNEPTTGLQRTIAESLIIGGWVAVWVPLERILYTGWPMKKEIAILNCLAGCDWQIMPSGPA